MLMFWELTISSDVCLAIFLLGCEAFSTGERLSPSWLKYTFFVFRSHWFACSVTFLSVGQFGFGVVGDAGFYVLLYVDRLHLLVPVLGTHLCGGSPWYLYLTTVRLPDPVLNKWLVVEGWVRKQNWSPVISNCLPIPMLFVSGLSVTRWCFES